MFVNFFSHAESTMNWVHDAIATLLVAIFGWAMSLERRLSSTKQQNTDVKDFINAKFDTVMVRFDGLDQRLERVENGLDNSKKAN